MYLDKTNNEVFNFIKDNGVVKAESIGLSCGVVTSHYFDIKKCVVMDSYFTDSLLNLIDVKLKNKKINYDTIAGVELGGVLISDRFIQHKHYINRGQYKESLNYLVIRKNNKPYGLDDLIIGDLALTKDVVIIEDVITTGNSVMKAVDALENVKDYTINVKAVVCVIDRNEDKNIFNKWCKLKNINYLPLFKKEQF